MMKEITRELNQELHGGIISKVFQPLPREIGLKIFQPGFGEKRLILSSDPKFGRIHLTKLRLINPPRPPRFCSYLRAHLTNARIRRIWRHDSDRIVYILCEVTNFRFDCRTKSHPRALGTRFQHLAGRRNHKFDYGQFASYSSQRLRKQGRNTGH